MKAWIQRRCSRASLNVHHLKVLIHPAALLPLLFLAWRLLVGDSPVNPVEEIIRRTGRTALVFLILSLACTPASIIFGISWVRRLRRTLGLYALLYASLHLSAQVGLDYGFDLVLFRADVVEKPFALAGIAAFLSLLPLAVTSNKTSMRRLGRNWDSLHRLAYLAGALAVIHFAWQVKADLREPALYGTLVFLLLAVRLPMVGQAIARGRSRLAVRLNLQQESQRR